MLLVDFLYHALTTLTASLPSFLSPAPEAQLEDTEAVTTVSSDHIQHTPDTPDTPQHSAAGAIYPQTPETSPAPFRLQDVPPTSRKRHDSMNAAKKNIKNVQVVQEIPSAKESGVLNPNTGFPEPLSPDRNTTLPHPSADTSKNATIEAEDLDLSRTHSRTRFLHARHHSHKSVSSYGKIVPGDEGKLYEGIKHADGSREKNGGQTNDVKTDGGQSNGVTKPVDTNGVTKTPETNAANAELDDAELLRQEKERDEQGYVEGERKKGILRKLHLHKV